MLRKGLAVHPLRRERLHARLELETVDQVTLDETLVEHDSLVVGAIGHRETDQGTQAEVAIGAHDGVERLFAEALELVRKSTTQVAPDRSISIPPSSVRPGSARETVGPESFSARPYLCVET
jgi:hypothetical protein